ncbi:unnamed protein product [Thlaspi arvense]|uniref:F-box domain-containing protein n=1 Tax=Thlaspi arvense TaxID=13288 RepID=A0AAU9SBS6_THLAR|nr:unnamed protein product [Thlaspi arvense]
MKTQRGDDNRESLPLDVVIEILTKLPAKTLFKFICVSKQWCSIILSRSFIDSFMSLSWSRPRFLVCYSIRHGDKRRLLFFSSPLPPHEDSNHSSVVFKHDLPDSGNISFEYTLFSNSVRGIICLSLENLDFVICNPTTRQVISIPNDPTRYESKNNVCFMYVGYDTSNDQFKILSTVRSLGLEFGPVEHSVCTLRIGRGGQSYFSSWRRFERSIHYFRTTNALCISGVLYYGARKYAKSRDVIVSFDVGSERLLLMEALKEERLIRLVDYRGKLSCFCVDNGNSYSLWILDDAKKQIWSKISVFSPSFCDTYRNLNLRICGATDTSEIIFVERLTDLAFKLFYYDLKKENVSKRIGIGGLAEYDKVRRNPDDIVRHLSISCEHVDNIVSL